MINLEIQVDDQATPALADLMHRLSEPTQLREFHRLLALDLAEATRRHIRDAARTRHRTRERLGLPASSGGYLARAAETVEAVGDDEGVSLRVAGAIFRRVNGPVTVRPREKKYLTIPVHPEALGRRADELWWPAKPVTRPRGGRRRRMIQGLVFIRSRRGNLLLARPNADGTITPYYALKTQVTLPRDAGLLPSAEVLGRVAERAARWWRVREERQAVAAAGRADGTG